MRYLYRASCKKCGCVEEHSQSKIEPVFLPERCKKCNAYNYSIDRYRSGWDVSYGRYGWSKNFNIIKPSTWRVWIEEEYIIKPSTWRVWIEEE